VTEIRLVAEAADAGAGTGAEGNAALDGRADDPGEDGRGPAEGIGRRVVVSRLELATSEQPPDPCADRGKNPHHVLVAGWRRGVKGEAAGLRFTEDAVKHERVAVEVELEAAPEASDHGDRPGLAVADPAGAGGARIDGEEREGGGSIFRVAFRPAE